jgi:ABC-type phosphate/phosphonate transport system substrate-binding protein
MDMKFQRTVCIVSKRWGVVPYKNQDNVARITSVNVKRMEKSMGMEKK